MAARRIEEMLSPKPTRKRCSYHTATPQPRKPIPGWTGGSDAWHTAVYRFSAPSDNAGVAPTTRKSFAASSHRRVPSTLNNLSKSNSSHPLSVQQNASRALPRSSQSYTDGLYAKYAPPFPRRSEFRSTPRPRPYPPFLFTGALRHTKKTCTLCALSGHTARCVEHSTMYLWAFSVCYAVFNIYSLYLFLLYFTTVYDDDSR
ncbi:hypothetical protein BV22DRAFT_1135103 [Leucogyrophana mollusca]|uniref:Uncharacterized protein n=1 Tax=Leucogyrophana mollusca TaxID=85980 RepID=A0ACB8AXV1_9AGAM|nr:hypothetical protein BV22DRAFT_1135103 [Leucogyrophana mollusca]